MAKKKVLKIIKLQIPAGKANPAPPIGPALGAAQVNIMDFCKKFNEESLKKRKPGEVVPVIISVYADKTFDFIMLHPPVADLIKSKIGIEKGSGVPNRDKVGKLTETQVREIAEAKAPDMRAVSPEARVAMVRGTARSMGVEITEG